MNHKVWYFVKILLILVNYHRLNFYRYPASNVEVPTKKIVNHVPPDESSYLHIYLFYQHELVSKLETFYTYRLF